MLRYKTKLDLAYSPCTTSGQETEQVYSYNPGTHTGWEQKVIPAHLYLELTQGLCNCQHCQLAAAETHSETTSSKAELNHGSNVVQQPTMTILLQTR